MPYLDSSQSTVIIWIILPLYADPSKKVRLAFIQFLRNIPSLLDSLAQALPASSEDVPQLSTGYAFCLFFTSCLYQVLIANK